MMCRKKMGLIVVMTLLLMSGCEDFDYKMSDAIAETTACFQPNTSIQGHPFGVNLDPYRANQLDQEWSVLFDDIDYLRAGHPFFLRITLRAQWMQSDVQYDDNGNPYVTYDRSEGSYYAQVKEICTYAHESAGEITILGILYGTPWFNAQDGSHGPGIPINIAVWQDFVQTMLFDFPEITTWEIWNEPDLTLYWLGTATEFGEKIYNPAREVIRRFKPQDTIIAPSWAQNYHYFSFLPDIDTPFPLFGWSGHRDVYEPDRGDLADLFHSIGGIDAFDAWGVHAYAHFAADQQEWSSIIQDYACHWDLWLHSLAGEDYVPVEYWITEIGIDTELVGYTEEDAADFFDYFITDQLLDYDPVNDAEVNGADPFITKMFIYELYDENIFNDQGGFMGLFSEAGIPKAPAELYRAKIKAYYEQQ
ncbi:hypothetical protein ACFL27_00805 [candidate division CSSED10-310 bacterium]|uniref:Glycoside hydrolase family 5 domain-containing protein n=1 Tax=candidate division CSSED10-310 bacterium TaxID=2855610 RepID=A0ABV6YR90_UNCC1